MNMLSLTNTGLLDLSNQTWTARQSNSLPFKAIRTCPWCARRSPVSLSSGQSSRPENVEHGAYDSRFAITLVDYFSKWPEVALTPTATTPTVMTFLTSVFAHEGNPCTVTTDNGPQFASSAFADFLSECGIKHIKTSVYHPQANRCVERCNRVLKDTIQTAQAT